MDINTQSESIIMKLRQAEADLKNARNGISNEAFIGVVALILSVWMYTLGSAIMLIGGLLVAGAMGYWLIGATRSKSAAIERISEARQELAALQGNEMTAQATVNHFCGSCGKPVNESAVFCAYCGRKVFSIHQFYSWK